MKKFRIVALLLVMCLASSCFVGGTFAKYSSTADASDSAVVAAWSITADSTDIATSSSFTFDLFNTIATTGYDALTDDADVTNTTTDSKTIIAPGTAGQFSFEITNASEVTANVSLSLTSSETNLGGNNIPIKYSTDKNAAESEWKDDLSALNWGDSNMEAGDSHTYTVYWKWAFAADPESDAVNANDTALGVLAKAAATSADRPTVTINATLSAIQVD
ncbi:MAG: hypothetical protein IJW99_06755 [Clostridia bacterium]|nr:hypothetical protein [Clostridia bacterium]